MGGFRCEVFYAQRLAVTSQYVHQMPLCGTCLVDAIKVNAVKASSEYRDIPREPWLIGVRDARV